ncbi:MAG: hypothetical protein QXR64_06735 [Pyrobaculum sp.]
MISPDLPRAALRAIERRRWLFKTELADKVHGVFDGVWVHWDVEPAFRAIMDAPPHIYLPSPVCKSHWQCADAAVRLAGTFGKAAVLLIAVAVGKIPEQKPYKPRHWLLKRIATLVISNNRCVLDGDVCPGDLWTRVATAPDKYRELFYYDGSSVLVYAGLKSYIMTIQKGIEPEAIYKPAVEQGSV